MILLIDIGNSRIKIGLCKNPNIRNDINVFSSDKIVDMSFATFIQNDNKDINAMNISKYIDEAC